MQASVLISSLDKLIKDYQDGNFAPILEADIAGYLYHLLVVELGQARAVHMDTRVRPDSNAKFDLVIGEVHRPVRGRPYIKDPKLVVEIKCFPFGFTDPQHRVHYQHVIDDDIPKLSNVGAPSDNRFALLFDEANYLEGYLRAQNIPKIKHIIQIRDKSDPRLHIMHLKRDEEGNLIRTIH